MKSHLLLALTLISAGCKTHPRENTPGMRHTCSVSSNPPHAYVLYLPRGYDSARAYPLVVSIDSHGSGSTAVSGFTAGADEFGFIVAGSNMVKNGMNDYNARIEELVADVKSKYKVNEKAILMSGFSGGARMAIHEGVQSQVAGVIACGASVPYQNIQQMLGNTSLYNIAGTQDFNLRESSYSPGSSECSAHNYFSTTFAGTHEWPGEHTLTRALEFMYVKLTLANLLDETVDIDDIREKIVDHVDSLTKAGKALQAYKESERGMKMFAGSGEENYFPEMMDKAMKGHSFGEEEADIEQNLKFEQMLCEGYASSFDKEDVNWWRRELAALGDTIKHQEQGPFLDMLMRTKGFVGILSYARTSAAARGNDMRLLKKCIDIYQLAEPLNPDMFYFKAVYMARTNHDDSTRVYLDMAIKNGYNDTARLREEFNTAR